MFERFALVAMGGFVIQLVVLDALTRFAALDYRAATAVAVEAAVLNNFVWHERWTWRETSRTGSRLTRVVRYHTATALLSIGGNLGLMWCFVELLGWPVLVANIVAVAVLGVAGFCVADRWVFRAGPRERMPSIPPHAGRIQSPAQWWWGLSRSHRCRRGDDASH
jgi:putative flippase GtrA